VDGEDGVGLVGRAGEHALELGLAQPLVDRGGLLRRIRDDGLVALGDAELEVLLEVDELLPELLGELELGLGLRALAQRLLGGLVVVPEAGNERGLVQIFEQAGQSRDVKDAPLAPRDASSGR
jgi:hypothetical protein